MQEKREGVRDELGGGPKPRPDEFTLPRPVALDRNRAEIILQKNKLYPLLPAYLSTSAQDNPTGAGLFTANTSISNLLAPLRRPLGFSTVTLKLQLRKK